MTRLTLIILSLSENTLTPQLINLSMGKPLMARGPVTVKQIQSLDKAAIKTVGIPSLVLMENAGKAVASEVFKRLRKNMSARVCVVCGAGNNGGDGFVAARHLMDFGMRINVHLVGNKKKLSQDAGIQYRILQKLGCRIHVSTGISMSLKKGLTAADLVVDAVFGVGLNRTLKVPYADVVETINRLARYVIAVDVPSGLDATTGRIYGLCVEADRTVTFSMPKTGFYKNEGPRYTGKITVAGIGIPKKLLNRYASLR